GQGASALARNPPRVEHRGETIGQQRRVDPAARPARAQCLSPSLAALRSDAYTLNEVGDDVEIVIRPSRRRAGKIRLVVGWIGPGGALAPSCGCVSYPPSATRTCLFTVAAHRRPTARNAGASRSTRPFEPKEPRSASGPPRRADAFASR